MKSEMSKTKFSRKMNAPKRVLCTFILLHACIARILGLPQQNTANDDLEIITVEEIIDTAGETKNTSASLITTQNNEDNSMSSSSKSSSSSSSSSSFSFSSTFNAQNDASNEPMIDIADDLIFLAERKHQQQHYEPKIYKQHQNQKQNQKQNQSQHQNQHQEEQREREREQTIGNSQQIDLITSAEEDSLTAALGSSVPSKSSKEQIVPKSSKDSGNNDDNDGIRYGNISEMSNIIDTTASAVEIIGKADGSGGTTPQIELRMRHVSADNTEDNDDNENDNDDVNDNDNDNCNNDGTDDGNETSNGNGDGNGSKDETNDSNATDLEELEVPSDETPITPIDMSDFVALIPGPVVKSIAANYYLNDPEVRRAYAYLNSPDFITLRQHIIELPEVKAFLRYLNSSGLDVVGFMNTLTNFTSKPDELLNEESMTDVGSGNDAIIGNEIENGRNIIEITSTPTVQTDIQATTEEQLNGLHGLVDSILDKLPQDQILATFFDKLESNEQFSKLVDNIGKPAFAKILYNMQNSPQLRILVFNLHNNGIYITRIVDSMKAYFFLATF